jgi:hypothetical protein
MNSDRRDLSAHILPVSATMVGVCMTVISILILTGRDLSGTVADDILAFDSLLFLVSAMISYLSIRSRSQRSERLERVADGCFLLGLSLMVLSTFLLVYKIF